MPKQPAIPGLRDAMKKKVMRREQFLAEMDAVVPWTRLLALIAPHYPKVGPKGGRPPMPLETMLRIYFLQNWYAFTKREGRRRSSGRLGKAEALDQMFLKI
jgi:IS5 family transposase